MWRGFFLGLGLFVATVGTVYLTPLRPIAVRVAGNQFPALKEAVQTRYQALEEMEQRLAASPGTFSDTLRTSQEKAWREYAAQRDNLTERIRAQTSPSWNGLTDWVAELWLWLALLWMGLPLTGALIGRFVHKKSPEPAAPSPPTGDTARFQAALSRIAEVSASSRNADRVRVSPVGAALVAAPPEPFAARPEESATPSGSKADVVSPNLFRESEPETVKFMFQPEGREAPREREDTPKVQSPNALIMEDQPTTPAGEAENGGEEDLPWGRLPETTEFEHLERQREEVLRCARKGMTSSEIARRLRISQDQVDLMIRMHRDRGSRG